MSLQASLQKVLRVNVKTADGEEDKSYRNVGRSIQVPQQVAIKGQSVWRGQGHHRSKPRHIYT